MEEKQNSTQSFDSTTEIVRCLKHRLFDFLDAWIHWLCMGHYLDRTTLPKEPKKS